MREPPTATLVATARRWMQADPDPVTSKQVGEMVERGDHDELLEHFGGRLRFGTAGLRAPVGPGPLRLNRLVARQTAAGIARTLLAQTDTGGTAAARGVVVAHDARTGSVDFAADTCEVVAAHGIAVHSIDGPAPTPLAAFALRHLEAAAAVVVTASHNPAADNGIKVYWGDGAQIAPPLDTLIAQAIDAVADHEQVLPQDRRVAPITTLGSAAGPSELVSAYLDSAAGLVPGPPARPMPLAVTSLHGVGAELLQLTLERFGHGPVHHVASQRQPDPTFPTVDFPNPEEPGALDEVISLAQSTGSVLALANDPDADRLAVAAPLPDGTWQALSGDETGALLAWHQLLHTDGVAERLLVTTVVSSRLTGSMADAAGAHFEQTLTGFKWLSLPGIDNPDWHQVIAYEEALGYALGAYTRDKDGITAALVAADAACSLATADRTVWDVLDEIAERHGAHVTHNGSLRIEGSGAAHRMADITSLLADSPPTRLGGLDVLEVDWPAPDVMRIALADDIRVVLRPSGTEPKFKYYCEAVEPVGAAERPDAARGRAASRLEAVVADLVELIG